MGQTETRYSLWAQTHCIYFPIVVENPCFSPFAYVKIFVIKTVDKYFSTGFFDRFPMVLT